MNNEHTYIWCFLAAAVYLTAFPARSSAQWSSDPLLNNAISTAAGVQSNPTIVSDGAGGAIIAWEDYRTGATSDVYAQRISSAGTVMWTANGVPISTATNDQLMPTMVSDGAGGAIITWYSGNGTNNNILAQRINGAGVVQWTMNGVTVTNAANNQETPIIVTDGDGGAVIVWDDFRSGTSYDIYIQRISNAGTVRWTTNGIALAAAFSHQYNPAIVSAEAGTTIVTWQDLRNGEYDIYAQRIDSSGAIRWTANGIGISNAADRQEYPDITGDGTCGAVITWIDKRTGVDYDIYAQRVDSSGTVQWTSDGAAISTAGNDQWIPKIIPDGANGAIIAWYDYRAGSTSDIYAQHITSAGAVQWFTNGTSIATAINDQIGPLLVSDGSGGAVITWYDARTDDNDVYAQRINSSGSAQWTSGGVAVSTAAGIQYYPTILSDGTGGATITWYDYRGGATSDIYASRISAAGVLPVELVSFTITTRGTSAALRWATATEKNNIGFTVERKDSDDRSVGPLNRSADEAPDGWKTVSFIEGHGTTDAPKEYSYIDKNLLAGAYCYRLKQVDRDGKFEYSHKAEVTVAGAPLGFVQHQNYPNPFNPSTTIAYQLTSSGMTTLIVYDAVGREAAVLVNEVKDAGYYTATFDASKFASGIYVAKLQSGERVQMNKMLMLK